MKHRPYDWTGESVRRREKALQIAKLGALAISVGFVSMVGLLALR